MSLIRTQDGSANVPGYEKVSKQEALSYQWSVVYDWQDKWEVWPLRYGASVLGVVSIASSIYINNHFRQKLKLRNFNRVSSYLPTVALPAIMTSVFHSNLVSAEILLQEPKSCAACTQSRAIAIQAGFGVLYPCILGPLSSFMLATRLYTYRLPGITENPRELFRIASKMFKPISLQISLFVVINAFCAAFMTYKEYETMFNVHQKLLEAEEEEEEEKSLEESQA